LIDGIEAIKKPDQCLSREPEKRGVEKEKSQEGKADYFNIASRIQIGIPVCG